MNCWVCVVWGLSQTNIQEPIQQMHINNYSSQSNIHIKLRGECLQLVTTDTRESTQSRRIPGIPLRDTQAWC